ncbi:MAG TPA: PKD domain-containing protein, partial [Ferruginibacter sp.]|nr:PKD domain-containing protein [Ferruginibacter sp.]
YIVKMKATSNNGCADSSSFSVKVYNYAIANFFMKPVCVNTILPLINTTLNNTNTTLNYLWDFGNGQSSTQRNPAYSYPVAGTYTIKLSVNTNQCPQTLTVKQFVVSIEAPLPGTRYPDKIAITNFPEALRARPIGNSVLWTPSFNLDDPTSYTPEFKGLNQQLYTIQLKTPIGCITVDTQLVKIKKKIEIYVPTAFTPDGNGTNDHLRPLLMGFSSVTYFRVYNRWGQLLYQMQSDVPGWDGRLNGVKQNMQTVVWMIEAIDVDGYVHKKKGTSILIR